LISLFAFMIDQHVPVDMYNRNVDVSPETISETSNQIENVKL